jgi:hypothetical protein
MRGINHHEDFGWSNAPRGGGKGGKGGSNQLQVDTAVDPETGQTFTSTPINVAMGQVEPASAQLAKYQASRRDQQKAQSDADASTRAQAAAGAETDFQGRNNQAYTDAMNATIRRFQAQGVDPTGYMDQYINPSLSQASNTIQDLSPNPGAAYQGIGDQIVQQALADKRTSAGNTLNTVFDPNYATRAIGDNIGDASYAKILSEQFDPLTAQLTNAQKRGTLTDAGYGAALNALNQKKSAAQSTLSSLGSNIISQNRQGINDIIGNARGAANNLTLGGTFDPSAYSAEAGGLAAKDQSGFEGALRNAVGGTKFADLTDLLNSGGAVQGATNPVTGAGANPLAPAGGGPDQTAEDQKKRGLGTVGAF